MVTLDLSGPLTALITIAGVAWILHRYILGVKIHVGRQVFQIEKNPERVPASSTYLSDTEEIKREEQRHARESGIAKR